LTWSRPGQKRETLAGFLIQRGEVSEPAQGNAKLREAEARGIELWDDELNRVYQLLQPKLSEPDRAKLRDAQRAWLTFRDANREVIQVVYDRPVGPGLTS
jgi:uncharacterized protein YecT (DUF1311 family)